MKTKTTSETAAAEAERERHRLTGSAARRARTAGAGDVDGEHDLAGEGVVGDGRAVDGLEAGDVCERRGHGRRGADARVGGGGVARGARAGHEGGREGERGEERRGGEARQQATARAGGGAARQGAGGGRRRDEGGWRHSRLGITASARDVRLGGVDVLRSSCDRSEPGTARRAQCAPASPCSIYPSASPDAARMHRSAHGKFSSLPLPRTGPDLVTTSWPSCPPSSMPNVHLPSDMTCMRGRRPPPPRSAGAPRAAMSKRDFPNVTSARIAHVDELAAAPASWAGKSVRVLARVEAVDAAAATAVVAYHGARLRVATDLLPACLRPQDLLQFIGELACGAGGGGSGDGDGDGPTVSRLLFGAGAERPRMAR